MHHIRLLACAGLVCATGLGLGAQWLKLPTPGIPRLSDGRPDLNGPAPRTADGRPDFSGLWEKAGGDRYNNNIAADLEPGDVAPWADALYQRRRLEFGKDSMGSRCLPLGPAYTTSRYQMTRIVQTPTLIALINDDRTHRQIFMDGRTLEPDPNPTWMGYSVGRWDGDVLVVESNGYTDRSWLDFDGHPHTEALRITERYSRPDFGHIDLHVTMVDPKAYRKPITFSVPMEFQADTEMLEMVCENERDRAWMTSAKPMRQVAVPATVLSRYAGVYDVDEQGTNHVVVVTLSGGRLWMDYDELGKEQLLPLSRTHFSWSGTVVEFSTAGSAVNMLIRYVEGEEHGPRRQ